MGEGGEEAVEVQDPVFLLELMQQVHQLFEVLFQVVRKHLPLLPPHEAPHRPHPLRPVAEVLFSSLEEVPVHGLCLQTRSFTIGPHIGMGLFVVAMLVQQLVDFFDR